MDNELRQVIAAGVKDLNEQYDEGLAKALDNWLVSMGTTVGQVNATLIRVAVASVIAEFARLNNGMSSDECRITSLVYGGYLMSQFKVIHQMLQKEGL